MSKPKQPLSYTLDTLPNFKFGWLWLFIVFTAIFQILIFAFIQTTTPENKPYGSFYDTYNWKIFILFGDLILLIASFVLGRNRKWPLWHSEPINSQTINKKYQIYFLFASICLVVSSFIFFPQAIYDENKVFIAYISQNKIFYTFLWLIPTLLLYLIIQPLLLNWLGTLSIFYQGHLAGYRFWQSFSLLAIFGAFIYPVYPVQGALIACLMGLHYLFGHSLRNTIIIHICLILSLGGWFALYHQFHLEKWLHGITGILFHIEFILIGALVLKKWIHSQEWQDDLPLISRKEMLLSKENPVMMQCPFLDMLFQRGTTKSAYQQPIMVLVYPFKNMRLSLYLLGLILILAMLAMFLSILSFSYLDKEWLSVPHNGNLLVMIWSIPVYTLVLYKIYSELKKHQISFGEFLGHLPSKISKEGQALFIIGFLSISIGYIQFFGLGNQDQSNEIQELFYGQGKFAWLANLLLLFTSCILGPIAEELFFRGLLLHRLAAKYKLHKALIWSSFYFGLIHFGQTNLLHILYVAGAGYLMGLLYLRSGSLKVCIFCHAIYNFCLIISINLTHYWGSSPVIGIVLVMTGFSMIAGFVKLYRFSDDLKLPFLEIQRPLKITQISTEQAS